MAESLFAEADAADTDFVHWRSVELQAHDAELLTVDVADLETAQFGTSHGGGIQGHEQGAVIEIACRIDEPRHFFRAEHDGQASGRFGKRNVLGQKMPA